jgi:DNA-binding transcriptional LysR family regulator
MAINELRAIATFAKAVELGSIRKAAISQGVTAQAASQSLAQLEEHLGVRLLHRTTRSLSLTDEGQRFLESTMPALSALDRALAQARESKDEIAGPLRIVGPKSSFAPILTPVVAEFCARYPRIQPQVQLDDGKSNWVNERVDVGFRIGASTDEGVIARRLFPIQLMICAAPAYIEQFGAPSTLEELASHRCSVFRHPSTGHVVPWYLSIGGEVVHQHVNPTLSTNDTELELQAVLSGQVVGQVANLSAADHIRRGRLVPLMLEHMTDHIALHLYYGSRAAQPRRVQAFIDLAIEKLVDPPQFVLSHKELFLAASRISKRRRHGPKPDTAR